MGAGSGHTWTQVKLNLWKGVLVKRKKPVSETNEIICALKGQFAQIREQLRACVSKRDREPKKYFLQTKPIELF